MRKLNLVLVVIALTATVASVFLYWPPFIQLAEFFADSSGRYPIIPVYGLTFLCFISPAILILIINILFSNRKNRNRTAVLDDGSKIGIKVKREKALYGALFPMDVYINGEKKGNVAVGKQFSISLEPGIYTIKVIAMSSYSPEIEVHLTDETQHLVCGFELMGTMQQVYVRK